MQQNSQLGNYSKLCGMRKDGEPFLVIPPNRYLFLICFLAVNAVSAIILYLLSRSKQAYVFYTVHLVILIYLDITWISTAISNPGIVLKSNYQQYNCHHCKQNTDLEEYLAIQNHCVRCSICVQDRDHHCAITGGCIGKGNKILWYSTLSILFALHRISTILNDSSMRVFYYFISLLLLNMYVIVNNLISITVLYIHIYNCTMNFLSLRSELQNWTLNSDDKLYRAIKELSQTVLQAEKVIINNIQTTRYEAIKSNVQSGCSYNQYLRISETKFTQNKIGERHVQEKKQNSQVKGQTRAKLDIFKQAIQIATKNLEITEEKGGENDLVSMSDTALSQSIYKDCRTPAIYGTKQFATNSFLNLFTDNQLNALVPTQKFETNQLLVNNAQQSQTLPPPPSLDSLGSLPPPPPLNIVLNGNNDKPASLPSLPPPPSLSSLDLPPPPPLSTLNLPSVSISNSSLLPSVLPPPPPLTAPLIIPPPSSSLPSSNAQFEQYQQRPIAPVSQKPKQLSMQDQLALRLKHGKNYKKQIDFQVQQPRKTDTVVVIKEKNKQNDIKIQAQRQRQRQRDNQRGLPNIAEQRQSNIRASLRNSYGGININPLINPNISKPTHQQPQQQEVDSFFGSAKSKPRQVKKPTINIENDIMKRQTFNQDILFKKKPIISEKKQVPKPKNTLFAQGSDQQSGDFTFKKKKQEKKVQVKVQVKPKQSPVAIQGKKKGLLDSESDQDSSALFKKKEKPLPQISKPESLHQISKPQPPKIESKPEPIKVGPLSMGTTSPKPNPLGAPAAQKKPMNPLFMPSSPQKQVSVKVAQPKKQQIAQIKVQPVKQSVVKSPSFLGQQQPQSDLTAMRTSSTSSQSHASSYAQRVASAGGMGMMGMMGMPRGMVFTKPSQAKKNQEQAIKKQKQQQEIARIARQQQQKRMETQRQAEQFRRAQMMRVMELERQQLRIKQEQQRKQQQALLLTKSQQPEIKLPMEKPILNAPVRTKLQTKKKGLFDDEQDENADIFKPKPKVTMQSEYAPASKTNKLTVEKVTVREKSPLPVEKSRQKEKVVIVETKPVNVAQPQQVQVARTQSMASSKNQLTVRRKKAKPTATNKLFDDDEDEVIQSGPISGLKQPLPKISPPIIPKVAEQAVDIQKQRLKKQQEQQRRIQQQVEQQLRKQKANQAKIAQIKRKQEQARLQQQARLAAEQLQRVNKQQKLRQQKIRIDAIRREQQIRRQEEARIVLQRKQQQRRDKQALQQAQMRQQLKLQKIQQQQRLLLQQQRRQQQKKQQERKRLEQQRRLEQLQRKQQQRLEQQQFQRETADRLRKQALEQQRIQEQQRQIQRQKQFQQQERERIRRQIIQQQRLKIRKQEEERIRAEELRRQKVQQERIRQQQQQKSKKNPLLMGGDKAPFLPKLPTRSNQPLGGPLGVPSLPKVGNPPPTKQPLQSAQVTSKKGSLFNDDDESELTFNKSTKPALTKPAASSTQKKGLFDDDDDLDNSNFLSSKKPQQKPKPAVNPSSSLFGGDDDDQGFGIKVPPQKTKVEQPVMTQAPTKQPAAKKSLFDDDDDLSSNTFLKKPAHKNESVSPTPIQSSPQKQTHSVPPTNQAVQPPVQKQAPAPTVTKKKNNLFDDDDDDDGFLSKKPAQKSPMPVQPVAVTKATLPPAPTSTAASTSTTAKPKKKNLFDDSGSDDDFAIGAKKKGGRPF